MFLDEIFAVGDVKFQEKATKVFESSWIEGRTVILVSHNMEIVKKYCSRAAFLKHGEMVYFGDVDEAVTLYMDDNH
jgi:ABC-2 type transport system ATP-binding protein